MCHVSCLVSCGPRCAQAECAWAAPQPWSMVQACSGVLSTLCSFVLTPLRATTYRGSEPPTSVLIRQCDMSACPGSTPLAPAVSSASAGGAADSSSHHSHGCSTDDRRSSRQPGSLGASTVRQPSLACSRLRPRTSARMTAPVGCHGLIMLRSSRSHAHAHTAQLHSHTRTSHQRTPFTTQAQAQAHTHTHTHTHTLARPLVAPAGRKCSARWLWNRRRRTARGKSGGRGGVRTMHLALALPMALCMRRVRTRIDCVLSRAAPTSPHSCRANQSPRRGQWAHAQAQSSE